MSPRFGWAQAGRIAFREARSASGKFLFVVLAVATGVGALTGVRGFSRAFETMLLRNARTLMAADLTVRVFGDPNPEQQVILDGYVKRGAARTRITETVSMMSSGAVPDPVLVSVKAVDPNVYPFYGEVRLNPPGRLTDQLTPESVAVSDDLLPRLNVNVGDKVRLGGQEFRIAGIVAFEPDRMTGSLNVGPRVMISREGLERTGLIRLGSRASQRFLYKLPPKGMEVDDVVRELRAALPEALIANFRETHPQITRGLGRATTFLSMVSLIALIVGSLGVATAMNSHLRQRMDTIAIMKCLGARSGQIIRIYVLQTILLGISGGLLGVLVGFGVQRAFPLLIERYFKLRPDIAWDFRVLVEGLAIGTLTALLFTLPPLLGIRMVRPGAIFRRDMPEPKPRWRERWRNSRLPLLAGGLILAGISGIAAFVSDSWRGGAYFAGGLAAAILALSGVAWLLLTSLRLLMGRSRGIPVSVRHGLANLYRPGNHAQAALVALGVGVMFTLSVDLIQRSLLTQIMSSAPRDMPNVFLINVTDRERTGITDLLQKQPGIESKPELTPSISARVETVNGVPVSRVVSGREARRFLQPIGFTRYAAKPAHVVIKQGKWWTPDTAGPFVSVEEEAARILGLKPGSPIEWTATGLHGSATVAAIHRNESFRMGPNFAFILNPAAAAGMPTIYVGGVRMQPAAVAALQRAAYRQFPTITVINAADILQIVQGVVDQIALVIRFISAFSIVAGAVILAAGIAGTRFRRVRELVIFKTLGARRSRLAAIFSVEFLVLGLVAGTMGCLLANGFAALILNRLLEADYRFDLLPNVIAIAATPIVANAAGWVASWRILNQKPLEVLRHE